MHKFKHMLTKQIGSSRLCDDQRDVRPAHLGSIPVRTLTWGVSPSLYIIPQKCSFSCEVTSSPVSCEETRALKRRAAARRTVGQVRMLHAHGGVWFTAC